MFASVSRGTREFLLNETRKLLSPLRKVPHIVHGSHYDARATRFAPTPQMYMYSQPFFNYYCLRPPKQKQSTRPPRRKRKASRQATARRRAGDNQPPKLFEATGHLYQMNKHFEAHLLCIPPTLYSTSSHNLIKEILLGLNKLTHCSLYLAS